MGPHPARIPPELMPEPFQAGELDVLYDATERARVHDRPVDGVPAVSDDDHPVLRWQIDGPHTAEWAMRKLAILTDHAQQVAVQAAEWRWPIDVWEREQLNRLAHHQQFFQTHLERYALAQRAAGEGATVALPSGKVGTRKGQPRLEVTDPALVLVWADDLTDQDYEQVVDLRVKLAGVQQLATLVEVPTAVVVQLACCGVTWELTGDGVVVPAVLSVWPTPCPECGVVDPGVANADVTATRWEARYAGAAIPGTRVIAPTVTAKAAPR